MEQKKAFFESKRNVAIVAIFYTFLWGSAFPLVKICMESFRIAGDDNMSKCLVAGLRFIVSGVITLLWCVLQGKKPVGTEERLSGSDKGKGEVGRGFLTKQQLMYILLYGILGTAVQYSFTYIGLSRVDGSKGAVIEQFFVFLTVLTGGLFFRDDKLNGKKVLGCLAGFAGVLIVNTEGLDLSFQMNAEGVMFAATICQAAAYFVAKAITDKVPATKLVGGGQLAGGLLLSIFALLMGGNIRTVNAVAVLSLLALSLISSLAYVLSLLPLKYHAASEVSSFNLLITVFGALMSGILLGESIFKWNYMISLLLVCLGILLINSKARSTKHRG